jgi:hypothetical protein
MTIRPAILWLALAAVAVFMSRMPVLDDEQAVADDLQQAIKDARVARKE